MLAFDLQEGLPGAPIISRPDLLISEDVVTAVLAQVGCEMCDAHTAHSTSTCLRAVWGAQPAVPMGCPSCGGWPDGMGDGSPLVSNLAFCHSVSWQVRICSCLHTSLSQAATQRNYTSLVREILGSDGAETYFRSPAAYSLPIGEEEWVGGEAFHTSVPVSGSGLQLR